MKSVTVVSLYDRKLTSILASSFFLKKLLLRCGFPSPLIDMLKHSVQLPGNCFLFKKNLEFFFFLISKLST